MLAAGVHPVATATNMMSEKKRMACEVVYVSAQACRVTGDRLEPRRESSVAWSGWLAMGSVRPEIPEVGDIEVVGMNLATRKGC
jgi:hypothetical protein